MSNNEKVIHIVNAAIRLAKGNNMNEQDLCRVLGTHKSKIYDWKNGRSEPSALDISKIAQYFNVTTDYLLGLTDNPVPPQSALNLNFPEIEHIKRYRELTVQGKRAVDTILNLEYERMLDEAIEHPSYPGSRRIAAFGNSNVAIEPNENLPDIDEVLKLDEKPDLDELIEEAKKKRKNL